MRRSNALLSKCWVLRELDRTLAERRIGATSQIPLHVADAE